MCEIDNSRKGKSSISWASLPEEVFKYLNTEIGDWIELKITESGLYIEKVEVEEITVELDEDLIERALTFRDREGYYTLEEALSNLVLKGLANLYRERGKEDEAAKIRDTWLVQIHSG